MGLALKFGAMALKYKFGAMALDFKFGAMNSLQYFIDCLCTARYILV